MITTLLTAPLAATGAASLAIAYARRLSAGGERTLVIDADASGSTLAGRLGEATGVSYSAARRGLPSLIASRSELSPASLGAHVELLDYPAATVPVLLGASHPNGGRYGIEWLAGRVDELTASLSFAGVHAVIAATLRAPVPELGILLRAGHTLLVAPATPLDLLRGATGLLRFVVPEAGYATGAPTMLVVEGPTKIAGDHVHAAVGLEVAGEIPLVNDNVLVARQAGRRGRELSRALDSVIETVRASVLRAAEAARFRADALTPSELPAEVDEVSAMPSAGAPLGETAVRGNS